MHTKVSLILICMVQCMKLVCKKMNLMSGAQAQTDPVREVNDGATVDTMGKSKKSYILKSSVCKIWLSE